jgi:hypothetical protein
VQVSASKTKIYMVLEYVNGGELFDKIVRVLPLDCKPVKPHALLTNQPMKPILELQLPKAFECIPNSIFNTCRN